MNELRGIKMAEGGLGRVLVMKLAPGSDLLKSIVEVADRENIRAGLVLSGAGSLRRATIRNVKSFPDSFPITDDNRVFTPKDEPLELLSLSGNISRQDDEVFIHCHITISSGIEDGQAYGGHLVEGCIALVTIEVIIAEITGLQMTRKTDPETQAAELRFEP